MHLCAVRKYTLREYISREYISDVSVPSIKGAFA